MALTADFIDRHIKVWSRSFAGQYYPYRKYWPDSLFHHAPLENAINILKSGQILSRKASEGMRVRDVAAQAVVSSRDHAHDRVRLYFRPKTPTQYHIEGIRKVHECSYDGAHAPILVMFVLDSKKILTSSEVLFSDINMQSSYAQTGDSEDFFSSIPFAKVYHEGPFQGDDTIKRHRCAEVLPKSPLKLDKCLKSILFRSEPERDTLLYLLGKGREKWANKCQVSDELKVFQKTYTFVQYVNLTARGVVFALNPRSDGKDIAVEISVYDDNNFQVAQFQSQAMAAVPSSTRHWIFKHPFTDGKYRVRVELEGFLACEREFVLGDTLI